MRIVVRSTTDHAVPILPRMPALFGQSTHDCGAQRFAEAFAEAAREKEGFDTEAEMDHGHRTREWFGECIEIGDSTFALGCGADALPGATRGERTEMTATSAITERRVR